MHNDMTQAEKNGPEEDYPKRPPRKPMMAQLEIFAMGNRIATVTTRNISERGVGGRGYVRLRVNQHVTIALDGARRIPARVAWQKDGDFGLELRNPLDLADFDLATTLSGHTRYL